MLDCRRYIGDILQYWILIFKYTYICWNYLLLPLGRFSGQHYLRRTKGGTRPGRVYNSGPFMWTTFRLLFSQDIPLLFSQTLISPLSTCLLSTFSLFISRHNIWYQSTDPVTMVSTRSEAELACLATLEENYVGLKDTVAAIEEQMKKNTEHLEERMKARTKKSPRSKSKMEDDDQRGFGGGSIQSKPDATPEATPDAHIHRTWQHLATSLRRNPSRRRKQWGWPISIGRNPNRRPS